MIGLVLTKPAVQTIAGVTPMPKAKVWAIKSAMLVRYNMVQITLTMIPILLSSGAFIAAPFAPSTGLAIVACCGGLLFALQAAGFLHSFRKPQNHARWLVCAFEWYDPYSMPNHVKAKGL